MDQSIAARAGKVFTDDDTHELHLLGVRSHGVRWHDPAAFTKVVSNGELVVQVALLGIKTDCNKWETLTTSLGEEDEAKLFKSSREVVSSTDEVTVK
jgi:hypothetical protein